MQGLLFFRVYPSDGFRFILIPDGNPSHEFPVLDGNPSSNLTNSANDKFGCVYSYSKFKGGAHTVEKQCSCDVIIERVYWLIQCKFSICNCYKNNCVYFYYL
jgi:hypothetical protein